MSSTQLVIISNSSRGTVLGDKIEIAETFFGRLRGLMFRPDLRQGEGLLLRDTPSIHMCFMRFPIDVIFLDAEARVVGISKGLRPWWDTASARVREARDVLELPSGVADAAGCQIGDLLNICPTGPKGIKGS